MAKTQNALKLGPPINADGSQDTTLHSTMLRKYTEIQLLKARSDDVVATVCSQDSDKVTAIGTHNANFLMSLVNAVLAGQGNSPDGSALFAMRNKDDVLGYNSKSFPGYRLKVVPKPGARTGARGYVATVQRFIDLATGRGEMIEASIDQFGLAPRNTRSTQDDEDEPVGISL